MLFNFYFDPLTRYLAFSIDKGLSAFAGSIFASNPQNTNPDLISRYRGIRTLRILIWMRGLTHTDRELFDRCSLQR